MDLDHRSTSLALIELVEKIVAATEKKEYTIGVFIDLRKEFHTVNQELLHNYTTMASGA